MGLILKRPGVDDSNFAYPYTEVDEIIITPEGATVACTYDKNATDETRAKVYKEMQEWGLKVLRKHTHELHIFTDDVAK